MKRLLPLLLIGLTTSACSTVSQTRDIQTGMTPDQVEDEIGSPSEVMGNGNVSVHQHTLYTISKPAQLVLAPVTYGLVYLFTNKTYWFTYKDGKLERFGEPGSFEMDEATKQIVEIRRR